MGLLLAGLLLVVGGIHHFMGGKNVWQPMLAQWQDVRQRKIVKGTIGFMWYGVTVWFLGMAAIAAYAHYTPELAKGIYLSLVVQNLSFAIVATIYGKLVYNRFLSSLQWLFFWPIAVTAYIAYSGVS